MSIQTQIVSGGVRPENQPIRPNIDLFRDHKQVVERISREIADYEAFLKESVLVDFEEDVSTSWIDMDFHGGSNPRYRIGFGKLKGQKERRLYYCKVVTRSNSGCDYECVETRPVVEAPTAIRVMLRGELPRFNEALESYLIELSQDCDGLPCLS